MNSVLMGGLGRPEEIEGGRQPQHSARLDLQNDPGEWHNLCGDPAYAQLEAELRALILERFDPDAVEEELRVSLERRTLLKAANEVNDLHWDYSPFFDATKQYCR